MDEKNNHRKTTMALTQMITYYTKFCQKEWEY